MDGIAYLIQSGGYIEDEIGQRLPAEEIRTEIFVSVASVSRSEFFGAGKTGLTPEYVLKTVSVNYSGEKELEYDGERYAIYRTFSPSDSDEIELYISKKVGVI
ncbi:MAG: phage head-tail adapter protein [Ruminococcaceae bacterium]|nr:phage head-tail adapter protein [Oscillospiraceae bacterium]